jgi:hypothetical protein
MFGLFQALTKNFRHNITYIERVTIYWPKFFFGVSRFQEFDKLLKNTLFQTFNIGFSPFEQLKQIL